MKVARPVREAGVGNGVAVRYTLNSNHRAGSRLHTLSAIWIGFLFGAFVVGKYIVLPNLSERRWNTPQQIILLGNTPRGIAKDDCLLGTTATLTHLVSSRNQLHPVSTAYVHHKAHEVLVEMGRSPDWSSLVEFVDGDEFMRVWDILRSRLGLPEAKLDWWNRNRRLNGVGVVILDNPAIAHAMAFANGWESDPSRPG